MTPRKLSFLLFIAFLPILGISSCKKNQQISAPVPTLTSNAIAPGSTILLHNNSKSPIKWKQYNKATFDFAHESHRIIFLVAASAVQNDPQKIFSFIESDAELVNTINNSFVPVLVDVDCVREFGIISSYLCSENNQPISFPIIIWLSPSGAPITSLNLNLSMNADATIRGMKNSVNLVSKMWKDDANYISKDSQMKAEARNEKMKRPIMNRGFSSTRMELLESSLKKIDKLYDSDTGMIHSAGSMIPVYTLDFLNQCISSLSLNQELKKETYKVVQGSTDKLLHSGAVDFLDGGFFHSTKDDAWMLPTIQRNALSQAQAIYSFASSAAFMSNSDNLQAAVRAMNYQEKSFSLDGLFSVVGPTYNISHDYTFWKESEIKSLLNDDEFKVIKSLSKLSEIGNIDPASDSKRTYLYRNALASLTPVSEVADKLHSNTESVNALIASAKTKLLAARDAKIDKNANPLPLAMAEPTLRSISAYAALYCNTGDEKYREQAVKTMSLFVEKFQQSNILTNYVSSPYTDTNNGRAHLYAVAMQTSLDIFEITLDEKWLNNAKTIMQLFEKNHLVNGNIEEAPMNSRFINIPVRDDAMLFGDTTIGVMRQNLERLKALNIDFSNELDQACLLNADIILASPIVHTDYLQAIIFSDYNTIIEIPNNLTNEKKNLACRMPLRSYVRKVSPDSKDLNLRLQDGRTIPLSSMEQLQKLLNQSVN